VDDCSEAEGGSGRDEEEEEEEEEEVSWSGLRSIQNKSTAAG
jgi:hypothetical protein